LKCSKCKTRLSITHTYSAGDIGKTQSAKCPGCGKKYTITSVIEEAEHGKGAYAKAQRLKKDPSAIDKVD
jgi:DNA-directed RNA polymerase subunit RPC12/RpoP